MSERALSAEGRAKVEGAMSPWGGLTVTHPYMVGAYEAAWAKVAALVRDFEVRMEDALDAKDSALALKEDAESRLAALREAAKAVLASSWGNRDHTDGCRCTLCGLKRALAAEEGRNGTRL